MTVKRYGVLIANSQFPEDDDLDDLSCPVNDVDKLLEVLEDEARGGFSEIEVLKDKKSHVVNQLVHRMLKKARKDDLFLLYYSGHGKVSDDDTLHLATLDTEIDVLESTSVSVGNLRKLMNLSYCESKIVILDCCYSGMAGNSFANTRGSLSDQLQMMSKGRGTCLMTASSKIQTALEADGHGVFTRHLIEGIRSSAADMDENGLITVDELYDYVREKVQGEGNQEPMIWNLEAKGRLVIARSGKTPRLDRGKALLELLSGWVKTDILAYEKMVEMLAVAAKDTTQMTAEDAERDNLLSDLLAKRLNFAEFIIQWHGIRPVVSASKPAERAEPEPRGPIVYTNAEKKPPKNEPEKEFTNSLGMRFVWIPPGEFMMGSPEDEPGRWDAEGPRHKVILNYGFFMQETPVTQGHYEQLMGNNPSRFKGGGPDCPVECVSWHDAQAFIKKLNESEGGDIYRLPSEAEWEYACRAGTKTRYYSGDSEKDLDRAGWYYKNSGGTTHPVGKKERNPFGLYDMHGNVWEWCEDDWHGSYGNAPADERAWVDDPRGAGRVVRGGSWGNDAGDCRSADRNDRTPDSRSSLQGFRVLAVR